MMEKEISDEYIRVNEFSGRLENVSCPICIDPSPSKLIFRTSSGIGIWQCADCEIMYASPRFTKESLLNIYENKSFVDDFFYRDWSYDKWKRENTDRSYVTQTLKLQLLSQFLSEKDRVLDVGCGTGLFCLETSKRGFNVEGIEPSGMLIEIGRQVLNVSLHHGFIEDFDPGYRYHGIVVWDVLEHVHNPVALVQRCNDLMEDGGYLFLQVPNYDGISNRFKTFLCQKRLKKSDFKHFGFPWHVYSFNKGSLSKLLNSCGFSPSLFESWSHRLKDGAEGFLPRLMISISKRFCLSDYITCVARKLP